MKADRSLLGVILIALVLSTIVTAFIIGEDDAPFSVVKNEYRESGNARFISGVTLLTKQSLPWLRVSHYCLMNRTDLIGNISRQGTPWEVCERMPGVQAFLNISTFRDPKKIRLKTTIPLWEDRETLVEKEFDVYLYDFSESAWHAIPDKIMYSIKRPKFRWAHLWDFHDAFACLFDENGDLTYFYIGVADFFINKVKSLDEMTIERNENTTKYLGLSEEGRIKEGEPSVVNAPDRGVILFKDLKRNDRLAVKTVLDPSVMPQMRRRPSGYIPLNELIHIVEIEPSTGETEYLANSFRPPKPKPEK